SGGCGDAFDADFVRTGTRTKHCVGFVDEFFGVFPGTDFVYHLNQSINARVAIAVEASGG
ncbi:MAG: hypothetical protein RL719_459, partial [Actinomycetota bacterium]